MSMELLQKKAILKEIPLFADLSAEEWRLIEQKSEFVEYKKGDIIYTEGSAPSAFYYIIVGRVVIYTQGQSGSDTILEYLHRGKYFGIISLLTGDTHSVTAKAMNDCLILAIKDEDFGFILKRVPAIAIDLSKSLSRRLKRKNLHQKTIFESTIISVFSFYPGTGKSVYALNLGLSLHKETHKSVIVLEVTAEGKAHSIPKMLGVKNAAKVFDLSSPEFDTAELAKCIVKDDSGVELVCLRLALGEESYLKHLVNILSLFTNDYHYIILDLPSRAERLVFNILNQSDSVHVLIAHRPLGLNRNGRLIARLKKDFHFQEEKIKIVMNDAKKPVISAEQELRLLGHNIFAALPRIEEKISERLILDMPQGEYSRTIRRIARREGDCQVGLALGVGVAYGFCHIGVLKVIEEEKIPIDIIAGSSMGAIIASLWATGRSSDEILAITRELKEPKHVWELLDFTFPFLGFIKGNKLYRFIKKYLGTKTFHDVKVPLKIIASDVKKKELMVFDKGLLADAIMASCSMPGVFAPFKLKEEMLFDGGIISPLPTEPLFEMGVKKIIAVNVTPSKEDIVRQFEKMKQSAPAQGVSVKKRLFSLKEYFRDKFKTNILDIIFSSVEVLQSEVVKNESQFADIVLHPDTSGLHWLEFSKAQEFAKRGEEETKRNLEAIWRVINE